MSTKPDLHIDITGQGQLAMGRILETLLAIRKAQQRSLCTYLNAGDPNLTTTRELIQLCEKKGIDLIELGVPFANSFTDGESVINSHQRALQNGIEFENVIDMVKQLRQTSSIPIVLLADFSHTVKARGLHSVIQQAKEAQIDGLLLHGLPPLYLNEYLYLTNEFAIAPAFSLYPNSKPQAIAQTLTNTRSFIYVVSQYGRTGSAVDFQGEQLQNFYRNLRKTTNLPLLAGFGIKNRADIETIFSSSQLDGVIIGSAITKIIEQALAQGDDIIALTAKYLDSITPTKNITYTEHARLEAAGEYTS